MKLRNGILGIALGLMMGGVSYSAFADDASTFVYADAGESRPDVQEALTALKKAVR